MEKQIYRILIKRFKPEVEEGSLKTSTSFYYLNLKKQDNIILKRRIYFMVSYSKMTDKERIEYTHQSMLRSAERERRYKEKTKNRVIIVSNCVKQASLPRELR